MCFCLFKLNFIFFLFIDPSNKILMCRGTLMTGKRFIRNMNDFPFYSINGLDGMRTDKRLVPNWTGLS